MCLGNHDYGNSNSTIGKSRENYQVQYSQISPKWSMPAKYYSFKRGPCEFFFLDTNFEFMSESIIMRQYHEMVNHCPKIDTNCCKLIYVAIELHLLETLRKLQGPALAIDRAVRVPFQPHHP